jgi:hypothetical protein
MTKRTRVIWTADASPVMSTSGNRASVLPDVARCCVMTVSALR